jgi:hypothetical protein
LETWSWFSRRARAELSVFFVFATFAFAAPCGCESVLLESSDFGQGLEVCRVWVQSGLWCFYGWRAKTGRTGVLLHQVCKVCTKSAKSASGTLNAHFVISLWKQMHTLCRLCKHLVKTLSMHTRCRLTAHLDFRTMCRPIAHLVVVFILYRISSVHKVCKVCKCRYCAHLTKKAQKYAISMHLHTMCRLCAHF